MSDIGVVYIARGLDPHWQTRISRFVESWRVHPPGTDCHVYVIYKECTQKQLTWAIEETLPLWPTNIFDYNEYNSWGGGCFKEAGKHVTEPLLCTLVSSAEVMHDNWLWKLYCAFAALNAGLVGCTGSQELHLHIRDTAILIECSRHQAIIEQFDFKSKADYDDFEHGPNNLTLQIIQSGKSVYVVEKDRVLAPSAWAHTTYRDNLHNVLVHDSGARDYKDGVRWD